MKYTSHTHYDQAETSWSRRPTITHIMHSCSAHSPTRGQSMMETMLIMQLPRAEEAPSVEAVPMAAAREHEVHVLSSGLLEHHAAIRSIMICARPRAVRDQ